jgi:WD40 repeat protein
VLIEAQNWFDQRSQDVSDRERKFISASREQRERLAREEKEQQQRELDAVRKLAETERRRADAESNARRRQRYFTIVLIALVLISVLVAAIAWMQRQQAQRERTIAETRTLAGYALSQFDGDRHLEGLMSAVEAGRKLRGIVKDGDAFWNYPTVAPLLALQIILDNICEQNRIEHWQPGADRSPLVSQPSSSGGNGFVVLQGKRTSVRELTKDQLQQIMGHGRPVLASGCSPDGRYLVTTGVDGTVRLLDLSSSKPARIIGLQGGATELAFDPSGEGFTTRDPWGTRVHWNLSESNLLHHATRLAPPGHRIECISFDTEGSRIAAAGSGTVALWSDKGTRISETTVTGQPRIIGVTFTSNGSQILTIAGGVPKIWDLGVNDIREDNTFSAGNAILAAFSGDGSQIALAMAGGGAEIWDRVQKSHVPIGQSHEGWILGIAISRDGKTVITGGADDRVRFWDALGREVQQPIIANQEQVTAVAISSDSVHVATGGRNGTVKLWEKAGKMRAEFVGHRGAVLGVEFSRDGRLLATTGQDGTVRLWLLGSGEQVAQFSGFYGSLSTERLGADFGSPGACFSPNGRIIATVQGDGTVLLVRIQGLDELLASAEEWLKPYLNTHGVEQREREKLRATGP